MSAMLPSVTKPQRGAPLILNADGSFATPQRVSAKAPSTEKWLQQLVHNYPSVLPIHDIEPGFGVPIPAAMEVTCAHGHIDNLLLTPEGNIVLLEMKLWKNPQARREVVAQVLDYIAALQAMSYEEFEQAILVARKDGATSLFGLVTAPELSEADFVYAVTRNLARGRVLAAIVGDGIREEARALAGLLQGHAGAHFTLALVQLNLWRDADSGQIIVVPDTLLQTVMIERGIVIVDGGMPKIVPMPVSVTATAKTITSEQFEEGLAKKDPELPAMLRNFIGQLKPLGVYAEQKTTLHLLADVPGCDAPIKLGYVTSNGQFWTENVYAAAPAAPATIYIERLARMIGGEIGGTQAPVVTTNGKSAPNVLNLLRDHADDWYEIIAKFLRECEEIVAEQEA